MLNLWLVDKYVAKFKSILSTTKMEFVLHSSVLERRYKKHDAKHLDLLFACFNSLLEIRLGFINFDKSLRNRDGKLIRVEFLRVCDQYYNNRNRDVFAPLEVSSWEQGRSDRARLIHRSHSSLFELMRRYDAKMMEN